MLYSTDHEWQVRISAITLPLAVLMLGPKSWEADPADGRSSWDGEIHFS